MTDSKIISDTAPEPVGLYPHARKVGNLLFLSGVGPRKKGTKDIPGVELDTGGNIVSYDIETQCRSVFENVRTIVESAGSSWDKLVDVTVFLTNMKDDFKTPFQTAHAPFGYADAFILQQIGLNEVNGFDGIFDGYIKYVKTGLPGGLTFKGDLHYFASEDFATTYGYEIDAVLVKKFTPNLTGLIKAAYFLADNSSDFRDIKQITADLSYKF